MWDWHGWGWGWWPVMGLGMLAFWAAVVLLVVVAVRSTRADRPDAESVLAERFARGEIDAAEYRQRLEVLHDRDSGSQAA